MAQIRLYEEPGYREAEFDNLYASTTIAQLNGQWIVSLAAEDTSREDGKRIVLNFPLQAFMHLAEVESAEPDEVEPN